MAALTLATTELAPAIVGVPYETSVSVRATGVAPLALAAGTTQTNKDALPDSLSYGTTGAHAGTIYGTPVPGDEGTYNLSVKVSDNGGTNSVDNQALTLTIYGAPNTREWLEDEASIDAGVAQLNFGG